MSQQTKLSPLNIKKRRGADLAASNDEEPITEITQWLRELIEKNKTGQRVMSPLTEERARQIVENLEGIGEDLETADTPLVRGVRGALSGFKDEMCRRLETDCKYAKCREKLEKLSKDGFFLRYGDYFANAVGDLRKAALEVSKEAKKTRKKAMRENGKAPTHLDSEAHAMREFLTQTWSQIDEILTLEGRKLKSPGKPPAPMTDLIKMLAKYAQIPNYKGIRIAISMYGKRNDLVHRHLAVLAKEGNYFGLATRLRDDLRALVLQRFISSEDKEITRVSIFKMIDRYFEEFKLDEDTYELMDYRPWPVGQDRKPIRKRAERPAPSTRQKESPRCG
ncbi:uncharacterized protein F4807DRAFT_443768 [Annulohypoxylon truncatum]|uniref:uncharacterized protein n=1 Tax=Annulohypoxylon truncatum TaxID=327061 RepID=UPI00200850BD|nr:uncharacterized protein F4807DRAFT_443768 [Annulohypoxylon truncatum]KAI1205367.1 hypothetical protein F4807DRAFT_443768 [Annulohypoxylon truncatum]